MAGSRALVRLLPARPSTLSWLAEDTDWPAEDTQDEGRTNKPTRSGVGGVAAAVPSDANGPCGRLSAPISISRIADLH